MNIHCFAFRFCLAHLVLSKLMVGLMSNRLTCYPEDDDRNFVTYLHCSAQYFDRFSSRIAPTRLSSQPR